MDFVNPYGKILVIRLSMKFKPTNAMPSRILINLRKEVDGEVRYFHINR